MSDLRDEFETIWRGIRNNENPVTVPNDWSLEKRHAYWGWLAAKSSEEQLVSEHTTWTGVDPASAPDWSVFTLTRSDGSQEQLFTTREVEQLVSERTKALREAADRMADAAEADYHRTSLNQDEAVKAYRALLRPAVPGKGLKGGKS